MSLMRATAHTVVALALTIAWLAPSGLVAAPGPSLKLTNAPGYMLGVEGHGWSHQQAVALTLYAEGWTIGLQVRPGLRGYLKMGVQHMDMCGDSTFTATDTAGRTASVHRIGPLCPSPANPPRPVLTVLKGSLVRTTLHRLTVPGGTSNVTMKLGDRLYLWEPGITSPMFTPHADASYLALLKQEQTPPRACAAVGCAQGFAWTWMAVRSGETAIDLSPTCRATHPPCALPDFAVRVQIVP